MVDRRLIEIPEPLADESFDEYVERLAVLSDYSLGVPPPIIVPLPAGSGVAAPSIIDVSMTANNGHASLVGASCFRWNSTGNAADNDLPIPGPVGISDQYQFPAAVPPLDDATMGHSGFYASGEPGNMWASSLYWYGAFINWPMVLRYVLPAGGVVKPSYIGMKCPPSASGAPRDFSVSLDGVEVLSVAGWSPAVGEWGWWEVP